jgi:pimeloyl-ACP methyl ester carboxylesterase
LDDNQDIIVHEGIFTAATMVADDLLDFIQQLILPQKFKVVITGHSLGAGTACLLLQKNQMSPLWWKASSWMDP